MLMSFFEGLFFVDGFVLFGFNKIYCVYYFFNYKIIINFLVKVIFFLFFGM